MSEDFKQADELIFKGEVEEVVNFKAAKTGNPMYQVTISGERFSGFGESPVEKGDLIEFTYKEKPYNGKTYLNIDSIISIKKTTKQVSTDDKKNIDDFKNTGVLLTNDMMNRNATLMRCAVDLCCKRNTVSDEEVLALYKKLNIIVDNNRTAENSDTAENK